MGKSKATSRKGIDQAALKALVDGVIKLFAQKGVPMLATVHEQLVEWIAEVADKFADMVADKVVTRLIDMLREEKPIAGKKKKR